MRDPEYVAALFENILEHTKGLSLEHVCDRAYNSAQYSLIRKRIIDLMVEIELGAVPDWDQINSILPTLEG